MSNPALLNAVLRQDLAAFIQKSFQTISPGEEYVHGWHIDAIVHQLNLCVEGLNRRLLITQPPRSLKSICTSVALPAWVLGHRPTTEFICVSYSQDLAEELARQFRLVINSDWYRDVFPQMRLKKDAGDECITTAGGGRVTTSIGGTLTGRGADIVVIDDPLKSEDAFSEAARRRVIDWYTGTLSTRLNDKKNGVIILTMQRLHEQDLAGYVLENGNWRHLTLPAVATEEERIEIAPGRYHARKPGEVLQPVREPMSVLDLLKRELGSSKFSAQYQQLPIPKDGNIVKRDWFRVYTNAPSGRGVRFAQSWDCATSTSATADYSACVTAAICKGRFYVLDVWRGRIGFPALRRKVINMAARYSANTVLIERAGPGEMLLQDFRANPVNGFPTPTGVRPVGDKVVRLDAATAVIERGDVLLPKEAPWLDSFLLELLGFPNGRHDDQADALSQLLNWNNKRSRRSEALCGPLIYSDGVWKNARDFAGA